MIHEGRRDTEPPVSPEQCQVYSPDPWLFGAAPCPTHQLDDLVALLDQLVDLPQGVHLGVLQLLLLRVGVCDAGPIGGHRLFCLGDGRAGDETACG